MQTNFFISLAAAIVSYILAVLNITSVINGRGFSNSTIYNHMILGLFVAISSLFTVGFGIAWIVEYYNATH